MSLRLVSLWRTIVCAGICLAGVGSVSAEAHQIELDLSGCASEGGAATAQFENDLVVQVEISACSSTDCRNVVLTAGPEGLYTLNARQTFHFPDGTPAGFTELSLPVMLAGQASQWLVSGPAAMAFAADDLEALQLLNRIYPALLSASEGQAVEPGWCRE